MFGIFKRLSKFFTVAEDKSFDYYISDIAMVLKVFGLDLWSADWKLRKVSRFLIAFVVGFLYAFIFEAYYFAFYRSDVDLMLQSFIVSGGAEMLLIKFSAFVWHRDQIKTLIKEIKVNFWNFNDEDWLEKKKIVLEGSQRMKFLVRIYICIFIVTITVYDMRPIFPMIYQSRFESPLMLPLPGENEWSR